MRENFEQRYAAARRAVIARRYRHLNPRQRLIQIIIKWFHDSEKFRRLYNERPCISQFLIPYRIFQIPTLKL